MNCLARLSVLYEDLRIETFALTAEQDEVKRLDFLDSRYRVNYFLRRSTATLLEFSGAFTNLSKTAEYKTEKNAAFHENASDIRKSQRELFDTVSAALEFFQTRHSLLKRLRNAVGGHFSDEAAAWATTYLETDVVGKLKITFDDRRRGGGAELHYVGEIVATAFAKALPGIQGREDEIQDAIQMIRKGYHHAAHTMQTLIILFLWDRFR
jgi:hypothetical protein